MTIVEKIINLLKKKKEPVNLLEMYEAMPEHSTSTIRGNLYRYLKKDNAKIQKIAEGTYSFIEIIKVEQLENEQKAISYSASYFSNNEEIHTFHKNFITNEDFKEGIYYNQEDFKDFNTLENHAKSLQAILCKGDAIEILKKLKDNSIDCLITDPPYRVISGGNKHEKGNCSGMLSKNNGKIFDFNDIKFSDWIPEVYRVLKDNSQGYIFTNFLNLEELMMECRKAGFEIHNLLVWEKNNATPNRWYMKNCEYVLFVRKGKAKAITNKGCKTVHLFKNPINKFHETEKPLDLLSMYIQNSSNEGDWILDLFGGSGATAVASLLNNRKCFTCEIDEKYVPTIRQRLISVLKNNSDLNRELKLES